MSKRRASSRGFTLPELLLAATILSFAIGGLVLLFIKVGILNEANRNLSIATSHAQFVMEAIKNSNFNNLNTSISNGSWNYNVTSINSAGLTALENETITTQASGTNPLDVTVLVNWQDPTLRNRSFVLETLICG